jgi:hypothetical protein
MAQIQRSLDRKAKKSIYGERNIQKFSGLLQIGFMHYFMTWERRVIKHTASIQYNKSLRAYSNKYTTTVLTIDCEY